MREELARIGRRLVAHLAVEADGINHEHDRVGTVAVEPLDHTRALVCVREVHEPDLVDPQATRRPRIGAVVLGGLPVLGERHVVQPVVGGSARHGAAASSNSRAWARAFSESGEPESMRANSTTRSSPSAGRTDTWVSPLRVALLTTS